MWSTSPSAVHVVSSPVNQDVMPLTAMFFIWYRAAPEIVALDFIIFITHRDEILHQRYTLDR